MMRFKSPMATLVAYRTGTDEQARAAADLVLQDDPFAVEAHLVKMLLALRADDLAAMVDHLRQCIALRPAEWIIERIRQDFRAKGRAPLTRDGAMRLGAFFRSKLSDLGPALPPALRRAEGEFVNVIGSSYVRSFGGNPAFFPLFIGMGPTMTLLSDAEAAVTRQKTFKNLQRLDSSRNTMLILNADPYYHASALEKQKAIRPGGRAIDEDFRAMDAVAERHRPILKDAKGVITGKLMLLGLTPTHTGLINELCLHLNRRLRVLCEEEDVIFLDWWDELADPQTGCLRDVYAANAYPGDIHFTLECTKRFMELLKELELFSDAIVPSSNFEWTHVFETMVDASEKTRIWCEPNVTPRNAIQSHKIAASHLSSSVADLITTLGIRSPDQSLLMVNVRDAFLPVAVPPQVHIGCVAFTDTPQNLLVGQQVLDFYGRSDVQLGSCDEIGVLAGQTFSHTVLMIHPDSIEADEARANQVLDLLESAPAVIVATPQPDRMNFPKLAGRSCVTLNISNRHIPEAWRNYSIVMVN